MTESQISERIAVVGAGAIGGFFAAQARLAGHDVVVCTRSPTNEIVVESEGETRRVIVSVATSPAEVGRVAWVLLATKAQDSDAAAPWLARLAGTGTTVAVMQNGLDHEKRVGRLAPVAKILPVLVYTNVERVKPGYLRHHFGNKALVPAGDAGAALAKLFNASRVRIDQDANFNTALWIKVLSNIAANTLTALTLQRNVVLKRPELLELSRLIMLETVRVAKAEGATIKEDDVEPFLRAYSAQEDGSPAMTSMVQDRLAGRRTEYDFINGEVVRRAAKHSIDVPINRAMYALLAAVDASAEKGAA